MKQEVEDQMLLRKYLLGILDQEKQEQLEARVLTDDSYFEEVAIAEDELIDSFLSGTLSELEQAQFENYFLLIPERRQKIKFARALRRRISDFSATELPEAQRHPRTLSWREKLLPHFLRTGSRVSIGTAVALLLIILGCSWLVYTYWRERPPEVTSRTHDPSKIIIVSLTPGLVRGNGELTRVFIPTSSEAVQLRLALASNEYETFEVELRTVEGRQVSIIRNLKAEIIDGKKVVVSELPASLLSPGDYQLRLRGANEDGSFDDLALYSFRVTA